MSQGLPFFSPLFNVSHFLCMFQSSLEQQSGWTSTSRMQMGEGLQLINVPLYHTAIICNVPFLSVFLAKKNNNIAELN